ncbi:MULTISPECIES: CU044_5270 family protein [unclassified Isoptericola]|uniref:CU044_5270 family protein n=1 Tax=unclassified Isoptericola TaxID=2623355 RepID=UPI00365541DA
MDEMTMLRQAGTLLDPPTAGPPLALRRRIVDELGAGFVAAPEPMEPIPALHVVRSGDAVGSGGDRPGGRRSAGSGPGRRRGGRRVVLAAGIAAVAAGTLAVVPTVGDRPAASAEAVELLRSAADRAAEEPAWDPRGDQFVYTRGVQRAMHEGEGPDGDYAVAMVTQTREAWKSVDAQHPGLVTGVTEPGQDPWDPDGGPWESPLEPCDGTWDACGDIPAFPTGMPTDGDAGAMLAFLRATVDPPEEPAGLPADRPDQAVFDEVVRLLENGGMPPEIEAGLLGAVAQIPGVTTTGGLTDVVGRSGVGVGLTTARGARTDIVIDPDTDEVLGTRTTLDADSEPTGWALLESGLVDAVGDTP